MENHLPDENKAERVLRAFRNLERREILHRRTGNIIWLITFLLIGAIFLVFFANIQKFKLICRVFTKPDSLLVR